MTTNFLALETVIQARLDEKVSGARVIPVPDLDAMDDLGQLAPAVFLSFDGYTVLNTRGAAAVVQQRWLAVVATRNVRRAGEGQDARSDAGALAATVIGALQGWEPVVDGCKARPLRMDTAPAAVYEAGFMLLPFVFLADVTVKGV